MLFRLFMRFSYSAEKLLLNTYFHQRPSLHFNRSLAFWHHLCNNWSIAAELVIVH